MDPTYIVSGLVSGIAIMWALFAFLMKDERARNDRLVTKLEEQNKTVVDAVAILGSAVSAIGNLRDDQRQFYTALDRLNTASERFERHTLKQEKQPREKEAGN